MARPSIGVARALSADPGVLLMDEPFSDRPDHVIACEFLRLQEELKTIVFVTHDIDEAVKRAIGLRSCVTKRDRSARHTRAHPDDGG